MPILKVRTPKRASNSGYKSTVTVVVFIGLCILGIWILTSNSVIPSQTTSRVATSSNDVLSSENEPRNPPTINSQTSKQGEQTIKQVVLESAKQKPGQENGNKNVEESGSVSKDTQISEESSMMTQETDREIEQVTSSDKNQDRKKEKKREKREKDPLKEVVQEGTTHDETEHDKQMPQETSTVSQIEPKTSLEAQDKPLETSNESKTEPKISLETQDKPQETSNVSPTEPKISSETQDKPQESSSVSQTEPKTSLETHNMPQETSNVSQTEPKTSLGTRYKPQETSSISQTEPKTSLEIQDKPQETSSVSLIEPKTSLVTQDNPQKTSSLSQTEHKTSLEIPDKPQEISSVSQTELKTNLEIQDKSATQLESNTTTQQKEEKMAQPSTNNSYLGRGANMGIPQESKESKKSWSTQADQSENQKERKQSGHESHDRSIYTYTWHLCNVSVGPDYIPCLDNEKAINNLRSSMHYEHRERHCPEDPPTCLVPLPEGYKKSIECPQSRDKIWYRNVPYTLLAEVKGHQNWVKLTGEFFTFPGGGTQFINGALHYIDFIQEVEPNIAWGKRTRVVLDVGCGVASLGGFLFERDVITMSFGPKDEHEAQVQFALERGIPAISAVMGTQRLQFPSMAFDMVHCARCRVPWHLDGGVLLLELNRLLRPGGYFVWSATPVYQKLEEDVEIWKEMTKLTKSMCWELVAIREDKIDSAGVAIYQKPTSNACYNQRKQSILQMCTDDDDPNAAWYVTLQTCMHRVPESGDLRGSKWPESWPRRLETPPYWLNKSQIGIYGRPSPEDFAMDYEHWKEVVNKTYLNGLGISWADVRNVMDMKAVYGGFAAALKDMKLWVMNVVNIDSPDTLPIIYERGLFGIYHDWCEGFSTYPRSYDLLHADHLFSKLRKRCKLVPVMAEIDRMLRPGGKLIVRDESNAVGEVENLLKSLHWEVRLTLSRNQEGIISAQKGNWRPDTYAIPS